MDFQQWAIASGYPQLAENLRELNQEIWDLMHKPEPINEFDGLMDMIGSAMMRPAHKPSEPIDEFDGVDISQLSPPLQTWMKEHRESPKAIVFVQSGEYYKSYFQDALIISTTINLPNTTEEGVPAISIASASLDRTQQLLADKGFNYISVVDESLAVSELDGLLDQIEGLQQKVSESVQALKSVPQNILDEDEDVMELIKDRCEQIQGVDDEQLMEWYSYQFDRAPNDLDGLRTEWKAFVHLNEYWQGDLEQCWWAFAPTPSASQWNDKDSENDDNEDF